MSKVPDIKTEADAAKPAVAKAPVAPAPAPVPFNTDGRGPRESRRRGALLRRLLALSDWGSLTTALCAVTLVSSATDVADLF